ncbi:CoA transferase [Microbacterium hominis]|uniref:CoA transferase n=1 Tax=Microbacterium hominis TaxID=162426 RepID=UPI001E627014|nr:CoA transferase [Microbacterium hominis]
MLTGADVVVLGYRPEALSRLGLDPRALCARHPSVIVARLSAWGCEGGRGFDSLVQAASGIAWIESRDRITPGALPAQALDHTAGSALAAGVIAAMSSPRGRRKLARRDLAPTRRRGTARQDPGSGGPARRTGGSFALPPAVRRRRPRHRHRRTGRGLRGSPDEVRAAGAVGLRRSGLAPPVTRRRPPLRRTGAVVGVRVAYCAAFTRARRVGLLA